MAVGGEARPPAPDAGSAGEGAAAALPPARPPDLQHRVPHTVWSGKLLL